MKTQITWSGRHPGDGLWMAYHDHELSPEAHHAAEAHLAACDRCREHITAITQMAASIEDRLSSLAPIEHERSDAHRALAQMRQSIQHRKEQTMLERFTTSKRTQRWVFGFAALAVVIGLFALEPVRAFASDFLGLFRVEKFVVVDIDPGRMDQIANAIDENMSFGSLEIFGEENGGTVVETLDEAAAAAGFTPRTIDGEDPSMILVISGNTASFTPDVASMRQVFAALDLDPSLLPDNIDGETFTFTTKPGVSQTFTDASGEIAFAIMQMPSPTVDGPSDVDLQQLGNAMLQLMGMSPQETARLSENIDWTSTFIIPVPRDLASVREVQVNGVTGLLFDARSVSDEAHPPSSALLWQQNGYVFGVTTANMVDSDLVELANSLK